MTQRDITDDTPISLDEAAVLIGKSYDWLWRRCKAGLIKHRQRSLKGKEGRGHIVTTLRWIKEGLLGDNKKEWGNDYGLK